MPTTQETDIRQFIVTTLVDGMNLPIDAATLTDASPLGLGGLDLESLALVELTIRLQRQFGVNLEETDIEALVSMTLGELVSFVAARRAAG